MLEVTNSMKFTDYDEAQFYLTSMQQAMDLSIVTSAEKIAEIFDNLNIHHDKNSLSKSVNTIDVFFTQTFSLVKNSVGNYDTEELQMLLKSVFDEKIKKNSLVLIKKLIEEQKKVQSLFKFYDTQFEGHYCNETGSTYHIAVGVHTRAIFNMIKGFMSIVYLSKASFHAEEDKEAWDQLKYENLMSTYTRMTNDLLPKIEENIDGLSHDIHKCDPNRHEHKSTFARLDELLEYFITTERFLNNDDICGLPRNYHEVKHHPEIEKHIDGSLICSGTLYHCEKINLDRIFVYGNHPIHRRYHGYTLNEESSDKPVLYGYAEGAHHTVNETDLNSHWKYYDAIKDYRVHSKVMCPIYGCYCDSHESTTSIRYFNTKIVRSDTTHNRVITGIRLKIIKRVVHLQITTGKLIGMGLVESKEETTWMGISGVSLTSESGGPNDDEYIKMDYHQRSLYLDDLPGYPEHYLTGVQFVRAKDGVRIKGEFTKAISANVLEPQSVKTQVQDDENRNELKLTNSKIPDVYEEANSQPMGQQNVDYIKFQSSDLKNDAGQTVVPFLDIQSVITDPPRALGGFGIYYKGKPGIAGFLTIKLIAPDFIPKDNL